MREVVLDTETTGLDPNKGDRIVEIGCVEILNHMPTGEIYHIYIDPERDMPEEAQAVHGLSIEFLRDFKPFRDIVQGFVDFIGDSKLVIHNASFDMKFINAELIGCGRDPLPMDQAIDTLKIAQQRFPRQKVNLDSLCKRFGIDNANRVYHGALLDAELLAAVYLELIGGREPGFELASQTKAVQKRTGAQQRSQKVRVARPHAALAEELVAHEALLDGLKDPLWRRL